MIGGSIALPPKIIEDMEPLKMVLHVKTNEDMVLVHIQDEDLAHFLFNAYRKGDSIVVNCKVKYSIRTQSNYLLAISISANSGTRRD